MTKSIMSLLCLTPFLWMIVLMFVHQHNDDPGENVASMLVTTALVSAVWGVIIWFV